MRVVTTPMKTPPGTAHYDVELTGREIVKPCPFCGGKARLAHTWTASYWFECEDCYAQVGDDAAGRDAHDPKHHLKSAQRALKIWNRRA